MGAWAYAKGYAKLILTIHHTIGPCDPYKWSEKVKTL